MGFWIIKKMVTDTHKYVLNQRDPVGREPIKIIFSLSLCSFVVWFDFANRPDRDLKGEMEVDFPRNEYTAPFSSSVPNPWPTSLESLLVSSTLRLTPQWHLVSFAKQGLWNRDSHDGHLSISVSWSFKCKGSRIHPLRSN